MTPSARSTREPANGAATRSVTLTTGMRDSFPRTGAGRPRYRRRRKRNPGGIPGGDEKTPRASARGVSGGQMWPRGHISADAGEERQERGLADRELVASAGAGADVEGVPAG